MKAEHGCEEEEERKRLIEKDNRDCYKHCLLNSLLNQFDWTAKKLTILNSYGGDELGE